VLLPTGILATQLGLMGVTAADTVLIVSGDKLRNATLVGMALDRLGHRRWAILNGGFSKWAAEKRPVDNGLSAMTTTT